MKKKIKAGIIVITAVTIALGGFFTYRHFKSRKDMAMMSKDVKISEKVEKTSFTNTVTASGTVLLDDEIEVYAEGETNIIKSILVEEGDTVSEGDLLVEYNVEDKKEELENKIRDTKREIENAELSLKSMTAAVSETELEKLKSSVAANEKSLQEAKNSYESYETKLMQQQNTVDNGKKDVEDAEKEVSDIRELLAVGGAAQSEYDTAVTNLEKAKRDLNEKEQSYNDLLKEQENSKLNITTAENDLKNAQNEYNDAKSPLNTEEKKIQYKQQELTLQGLKDNLADYNEDLSQLVYTTDSAVNGKVTEICVDEGTYTEENTVILKVADFGKLIVSASIEEYDAPLLELGQKVVMTSDGLEGKEYTGSIIKINDSAQAESTNMGSETAVPIEISVDNPDGVLKPGYNLDLEITVVNKENVLTVSSGSIVKDEKEGTEYVFAVEGGVLKKKEVITGETNDTDIEIVSGLNEGDEIISSGNKNLTEGMLIKDVKEQIENKSTENNKSGGNNESMNGGMINDKNREPNQGIPSGNFGGGGFGGGRPMG